MPIHSYPVYCYQPGCGKPALYKIAARWSDGATQELKTYGLTCAECLPAWYQRSLARRAACRLTAGETLELPGIFELARGNRDRQLSHREDLEKQLRDKPVPG